MAHFRQCPRQSGGLVVDALGGAPGIYSARYASLDGSGADHNFSSNIAKLLHNLEGVSDRRACFVCVAALVLPSGDISTFSGSCEGRIAYEPAGCGGFGYDPVFIADAYPDRTLAEVDEDAKNAISHRGNALMKMMEYLKTILPKAH